MTQPIGFSPVFKWVNLISTDNVVLIDPNGQATHSLGTGFDTDANGDYPSLRNLTATTTNDNPSFGLVSPCTDVSRNFSATVYLMWNAGLTSPASIDVPLGSLNWGFTGEAVLNSGMWTLKTSSSSDFSTGFTSSSTYPKWTTFHQNGSGPACP